MANFMRKIKRNNKKSKKKIQCENIYDLVQLVKKDKITDKEFNDILYGDKKIYDEYMNLMLHQLEEQKEEKLNRIKQQPIPPELESLEEECRDTLLLNIKQSWDRLYDPRGGAAHDLPNFCVRSDFDWLRETIDSEFDYIFDNEEDCYDYELEIESYLDGEKSSIMYEISSLEDEIVYSATDRIYEYITTEPRPEYQGKKGLKRLEDMFLEKKVVSSKEELYELESYKKALEYVNSL